MYRFLRNVILDKLELTGEGFESITLVLRRTRSEFLKFTPRPIVFYQTYFLKIPTRVKIRTRCNSVKRNSLWNEYSSPRRHKLLSSRIRIYPPYLRRYHLPNEQDRQGKN